MEKLVQLLPSRAQAFVHQREPQTLLDAVDLASSYFYSHDMDKLKWESDYKKKQQQAQPSPKHFSKHKFQSQHQSDHQPVSSINTLVTGHMGGPVS